MFQSLEYFIYMKDLSVSLQLAHVCKVIGMYFALNFDMMLNERTNAAQLSRVNTNFV